MVRKHVPKKVLKNGRDSTKVLRNKGLKNGPRECGVEQFVWLPLELVESEAWRALSVNGRRLIDRLVIERAHHSGQENGGLIVTHAQFEAYGLSRNSIRGAIEEAVAFGLLRVKQGGRYAESNQPNRYRLTWMGWWNRDGQRRDPTNDWKAATPEWIERWKAERAKSKAARRQRKSVQTPKTASTVPPCFASTGGQCRFLRQGRKRRISVKSMTCRTDSPAPRTRAFASPI